MRKNETGTLRTPTAVWWNWKNNKTKEVINKIPTIIGLYCVDILLTLTE